MLYQNGTMTHQRAKIFNQLYLTKISDRRKKTKLNWTRAKAFNIRALVIFDRENRDKDVSPLSLIILILSCSATREATPQFLKPIMFADDTNLFCSNNEIKPLFLKANLELGKISEWFLANKLFLNKDKTRFRLFYRPKIEIMIIYSYDYLL